MFLISNEVFFIVLWMASFTWPLKIFCEICEICEIGLLQQKQSTASISFGDHQRKKKMNVQLLFLYISSNVLTDLQIKVLSE